jgi:KDO2-lipid IV(A) lauroyltransferase
MGFKLFLVLEHILMILPRWFRKNFFIFLATLAYHLSSRYRTVGFKNLDFIFGDTISLEQKRAIVKYSFQNLLLNFYHLMNIKKMKKDDVLRVVTAQNLEVVESIKAQNRPIVYIAAHYGAWELGVLAVGVYTSSITGVFKKMKDKRYQKWMIDARSSLGNIFLEKASAMKPLMRAVKNNQSVAMMIDTSISSREGAIVDLFGKQVRQTTTAAYLARKFGAAIVPVSISTQDDENFTLCFYDEIKIDPSEDEEADILQLTQLQADWFGSLIRDEPKFWFWVHRRFKGEYPHIYR